MTEHTSPQLNIVCAIKAKDFDSATDWDLETENSIEDQHGIWNKGTLKWWVKGEVRDELFEQREQFMIRCLNIAFTEIDIEIPIVLIHAESEDDADIILEFGLRANDRYYSGDNGKFVLAYAGYPIGALKGYMKIFTDWNWETRGSYNIITVLIHELGHIMGRPHSERRQWVDMMDPIINAKVTELSDHDVAGLVMAYGARVYSGDPAHSKADHDRLENTNRIQKERLRFG